jgi:hypothetical protein
MSIYSNLKFELMVTGQNASTWGDVTNTNLGTAIEQAISETATITFASNNVSLSPLSDTNGLQDGRALRLNLTGTTGGARNLTVPAIQKPYIVNNGCADPVTVKTPSGTGIAVPAGKTMWVYSNGTDVVDVTTHLTSLTLGSPLPVASGGTGSNSGNAASLTGFNASNVTTGTLVVAYGGTGSGNAAGARVNLLPSYTGNGGKLLALNSGGTDVEWISAGGAGTVTSVNATTAISGLSFTGGPITSAGTLTLTGTLGVQGGGTGTTSLTSGAVLIGAGTSAVTTVSPGTSGNVLVSNGSAWVSQAASGSGTVTSVSGVGTVNGITLSGNVTSSGALTLGGSLSNVSLTSQVIGTLPAGNGGTGLTTPGTSGNVLTSNGSGWVSQAPSAGGGTVSLNDGSAASPSLNFSSDTNTGLYRVGSDQLGLAAGGTNQVTISTSAVTTTVAVVGPTGLGASTPVYTFSGDTTTGLAYFGAGSMRFVNSGTPTLGFSSSSVNMLVPMRLPSYTTTTLPAATLAGQMIYVTNETGGAVPAFSDGTNWRRVTDRAIVA